MTDRVTVTADELEALPWKDVTSSSNIERVAWGPHVEAEADEAVLHVQFSGGRVYRYAAVPYELNVALMEVVDGGEESVGGFVARFVRGQFETVAVEVDG